MLRSLTAPNAEAILPLASLKARVRIIGTDEDADIERMRAQAIDFVERYGGLALGRRQFQWTQDQFSRSISLPIGPVVSVDAVSYFTAAGVDTALASTDWYAGGGVVQAAIGKSWPYASGQPGGVRVTFTAGLLAAATDAPMLVAAVEVAVAAMHINRETPDFSAAMRCADQYRAPGI